jgi:serine/threonine protein kinase
MRSSNNKSSTFIIDLGITKKSFEPITNQSLNSFLYNDDKITHNDFDIPNKVNFEHVINGQIFEENILDEIKMDLPTLASPKKIKEDKQGKPLKYSILLANNEREEAYALYNCFKKKSYKQEGYLGKGGYARVKLAQDLFTKKWYAAKIFYKPMIYKFLTICCRNAEKNEIAILKRLGKLHSVIEMHNKKYIIQTLSNGEPLTNLFFQLDESKIVSIIYQLMAGVRELHKNKVLHLDLHPNNVLYNTNTDHLDIVDFGLSLITKNGQSWRMIPVGVADYIPPEHKKFPLYVNYSEATDWYAVGKIISFLLRDETKYFLPSLIEKLINDDPNKRSKNIDDDITNLAILNDKLQHLPTLQITSAIQNSWIFCRSKKESEKCLLPREMKDLETLEKIKHEIAKHDKNQNAAVFSGNQSLVVEVTRKKEQNHKTIENAYTLFSYKMKRHKNKFKSITDEQMAASIFGQSIKYRRPID